MLSDMHPRGSKHKHMFYLLRRECNPFPCLPQEKVPPPPRSVCKKKCRALDESNQNVIANSNRSVLFGKIVNLRISQKLSIEPEELIQWQNLFLWANHQGPQMPTQHLCSILKGNKNVRINNLGDERGCINHLICGQNQNAYRWICSSSIFAANISRLRPCGSSYTGNVRQKRFSNRYQFIMINTWCS